MSRIWNSMSFQQHQSRFGLLVSLGMMGLATMTFVITRRFVQYRERIKKVKQIRSLVKGREKARVEDIHVVSDLNHCERLLTDVYRHLASNPVLGFDCEWVSSHDGGSGKIALIQLALTNGQCYLLRTCQIKPLPKSLVGILADETVLKLGVGIQDDGKKMMNDFGVMLQGVVDLRFSALKLRPNLKKTGLAGLASAFVGIELDKDWRIRASNWEAKSLTQRQILYAANDALVGVNIGFVMLAEALEKGNMSSSNVESPFALLEKFVEPYRDRAFKLKGLKSGRNEASNRNSTANRSPSCHSLTQSNQIKPSQFRKKPLYQNSMLEAPDGQPLCVCDTKKAEWYVTKGLGSKIKDDPFTVRLNFEPKGRPEGEAGEYYLSFKENVCVVCGATESYLRKYIVPHEYRKYFPEIMRDHQSHDVLLMCYHCHRQSNLHDLELRRTLANECDAPIGTEEDIKVQDDPDLKAIRSAARALIKNKQDGKIPLQRVKELELVLKDYYETDDVTESILKKGANLESRIVNENYQPHGKKVVDFFKEEGGLIQLEKRWRQHFLNSMNPKFLPPLWSVNHQEDRLDIKAAENRISQEDYQIASGRTKLDWNDI